MKEVSIAIASMGLILGLHADTTSGLIAGKEIWGSGYGEEGVSPSSVDDDSDEDQDNQKNEPWPNRKPDADEGADPSIFDPKASKDIFEPPGGD